MMALRCDDLVLCHLIFGFVYSDQHGNHTENGGCYWMRKSPLQKKYIGFDRPDSGFRFSLEIVLQDLPI